MLWHHSPAFAALETPLRLLQRGFLGVDFFFVLSGFLITTLLLRERAVTGRFSLRAFYWRRALRILPPYLLIVTVVSAWFVLVRGETAYAPLVPFYYLFLANFLTADIPLLYPLWSLSVEEQFYLVWPALLAVLPRRAALPALALLIGLNLAGIVGLFGTGPDLGPLHLGLPNATYAPILMGAALALLLESRRGFALLGRVLGGWLAPAWTAALVLILAATGPADLRGLPNLAIHLAMTACLASLVLREDGVARPLLTWGPIARIGEISYGVYLYHLLALDIARRIVGRVWPGPVAPWVETLCYLALAISIAALSFATLEAWFRKLRHRPSRQVPAEVAPGTTLGNPRRL